MPVSPTRRYYARGGIYEARAKRDLAIADFRKAIEPCRGSGSAHGEACPSPRQPYRFTLNANPDNDHAGSLCFSCRFQ